MKSFLVAGRKALAFTLCMGLLSTSAFAADKKEESDAPRVITYEQAVQMGIDNDLSLGDLANKIDYLQDNKSDLFRDSGGDSVPPYDGVVNIVDSDRFTFLSSVTAYSNNIEITRLTDEITRIGIEAAVKQYFSAIQTDEISLETAKENLNVQRQLLAQGRTKETLGLMSPKELEQLQRDTDEMERNVKLLELTISNEYIELNKLLGLQPEDRYQIENNVEYTPLEMKTTLDTYVQRKVSTDQSLKIQALALDTAEFSKNFFTSSSRVADHRTNEYNYESAATSYADAKKQKKVAIESAYIKLQQLEETHKNLEKKLEKAKSDYETAQVNYEVGNITKLTLDQAALAITSAEKDLKENELTHDMLLFSFDNTCVLGNVGGGSSSNS